MKTLLLGDLGNHLNHQESQNKIDTLRQTQNRARATQFSQTKEITVLRGEIERQRLAIEALTRYLVSSGVVDEAKFDDFIKEVDAEDGVVDGKLALDPSTARLKLIMPKKPG